MVADTITTLPHIHTISRILLPVSDQMKTSRLEFADNGGKATRSRDGRLRRDDTSESRPLPLLTDAAKHRPPNPLRMSHNNSWERKEAVGFREQAEQRTASSACIFLFEKRRRHRSELFFFPPSSRAQGACSDRLTVQLF